MSKFHIAFGEGSYCFNSTEWMQKDILLGKYLPRLAIFNARMLCCSSSVLLNLKEAEWRNHHFSKSIYIWMCCWYENMKAWLIDRLIDWYQMKESQNKQRHERHQGKGKTLNRTKDIHAWLTKLWCWQKPRISSRRQLCSICNISALSSASSATMSSPSSVARTSLISYKHVKGDSGGRFKNHASLFVFDVDHEKDLWCFVKRRRQHTPSATVVEAACQHSVNAIILARISIWISGVYWPLLLLSLKPTRTWRTYDAVECDQPSAFVHFTLESTIGQRITI